MSEELARRFNEATNWTEWNETTAAADACSAVYSTLMEQEHDVARWRGEKKQNEKHKEFQLLELRNCSWSAPRPPRRRRDRRWERADERAVIYARAAPGGKR